MIMNNRVVLTLWVGTLVSFFVPAIAAAAAPAADAPPNIIVILTDDLGYGDLGVYGHPSIRTPHLDRMAAEGNRFTDFYCAAPICTPSRAGLLTGRVPVRSGMAGEKNGVLWPISLGGLPDEELTMAEVLKQRGYATACVGKWHLGHLPEFLPMRHGFDSYFGIPYSNDMANAKRGHPPTPLMRNEKVIEAPVDQSTITKRYTEESIRFIQQNKDKPFFLYLAHTFPHTPLHASDDFRGKSPRGLYGDVVEELDWSVGQILHALRDGKIAEKTLVIFTSDNGPWLIRDANGGSAGLLRDGKGSTWEGGMRVPTIAWWPGRIKPGTITRAEASFCDLLPTFAELAGATLPGDIVLDGDAIVPTLLEGSARDERPIFYYQSTQLWALRKGPWKIHFQTGSRYDKTPPQKHEPQLFHVQRDPSEQFDVAQEHPKIVADLTAEADRHRKSIVPVKLQLEEWAATQPAKAAARP
jgi:arylsulfatase A-like enzyme